MNARADAKFVGVKMYVCVILFSNDFSPVAFVSGDTPWNKKKKNYCFFNAASDSNYNYGRAGGRAWLQQRTAAPAVLDNENCAGGQSLTQMTN